MSEVLRNTRALVVDDEPDLRELLDMTLSRMGLEVDTAEDLASARRLLGGGEYAFCLTDMRLPDGNGLNLIEEIGRDHPHMPVAMLTAHGRVEDAVTALKAGAFDFVSKPVDLENLRNLVKAALKLRADRPAATPEPDDAATRATTGADRQAKALARMIGKSAAIQRVRETIAKLSRSQAPVMIGGDSGSGKELAAQLIHELGPRADSPFIAVNCGAIPTELMESEFFGHVKGSFTGADSDKDGLFQAANGGTLFLDEVADLPLSMQVKLLRAIQEKSVRPIGARAETKIDVRILSASHKPLKPLVESGDFRSDLYYRLNVIELTMPPLKDRPEDIEPLTRHYLKKVGAQWNEPARQISPQAMDLLKRHAFSGNVRELVNILQRAVTLCEGEVIEAEDLQLKMEPFDEAQLPDHDGERNLDDYMEDVERQILERALADARYNKTRAAKQLGISFRSLRYKLKKYGIE